MDESAKQTLQENVPAEEIKTREQAGVTLSYIEGWRVVDLLNEIFGPDGWESEVIEIQHLGEREVCQYEEKGRKIMVHAPHNEYPHARHGWRVGYRASVKISTREEPGFVYHEGCGAGDAVDYNSPFEAHKGALTEAETHALKRAAVKFGRRLGLSLYDEQSRPSGGSAPPQSDDGKCRVHEVKKVKEGKTKQGKPYELWAISFTDGREGTTFDTGIVESAQKAAEQGSEVEPQIEEEKRGQKTYQKITGLDFVQSVENKGEGQPEDARHRLHKAFQNRGTDRDTEKSVVNQFLAECNASEISDVSSDYVEPFIAKVAEGAFDEFSEGDSVIVTVLQESGKQYASAKGAMDNEGDIPM